MDQATAIHRLSGFDRMGHSVFTTRDLAKIFIGDSPRAFGFGLLVGTRKGDKFYRANGGVVQADWNAARNVFARRYDTEISRYLPYKQVREILQKRTDRYRLELTNPDSGYTPGNWTLTESELIL